MKELNKIHIIIIIIFLFSDNVTTPGFPRDHVFNLTCRPFLSFLTFRTDHNLEVFWLDLQL